MTVCECYCVWIWDRNRLLDGYGRDCFCVVRVLVLFGVWFFFFFCSFFYRNLAVCVFVVENWPPDSVMQALFLYC